MGGSGKKKKARGRRQAIVSAKPKGKSSGGGIGQQIGSVVASVAKEVLPTLLGMLAFPTSGASACATPNLAISRGSRGSGYNGSMALSAPAANGTYVKHGKAKIKTSNNGMQVSHREYIEDITFGAAGEYVNVVAQPINPGNRNLFPWLSSIASRFETYRFNSLRFIYEPQCGTDTQGTIMTAVDFDAVDPPPIDKLQIMTYDGAVRSPPWFASVYECTPANLHKYKEYFITPGLTTPLTTDVKTYFVGNVFVATQSLAAAFTSGELYVEYDVSFMTPQLSNISNSSGYLRQVTVPVTSGTLGTFQFLKPDAGNLDVMWLTPGNLNPMWVTPPVQQGIVIPNPGSYMVQFLLQSVPDSEGVYDIRINSSSPPPGFEQTSVYYLPNNDVNAQTIPASSGALYTGAICTNFQGPLFLWFDEVTFTLVPATTYTINIAILVTPIDDSIYSYVAPLSTPPTLVGMTRLERMLKKQAARASTMAKAEQPAVDIVVYEPKVKEQSLRDNVSRLPSNVGSGTKYR
jgi:hypothetical protein